MDSSLPPEVRAALQARREMFAQSPSILPHLHRRIRVAAMEPASFRERLLAWVQPLRLARPAIYAGAFAVVALTLTLARFTGRPAGAAGTTVAARTTSGTSYSLNEVGALPASLDQKIDEVISGTAAPGNRPGARSDAHYVLTSTPASYDSVVAF